MPKLIEFIKTFRNFASNNTGLVKHIYNTDEILNNDVNKLLNCSAFKDLSIYYEKQGFYSEAIKVCDATIACGYVKDGTKSRMIGRKEKLKKKTRRSKENANNKEMK